MSQSDDLLHGIRQKILDGTLPKQDCRMTWYGGGTGGICVACELPIAAVGQISCAVRRAVFSSLAQHTVSSA